MEKGGMAVKRPDGSLKRLLSDATLASQRKSRGLSNCRVHAEYCPIHHHLPLVGSGSSVTSCCC